MGVPPNLILGAFGGSLRWPVFSVKQLDRPPPVLQIGIFAYVKESLRCNLRPVNRQLLYLYTAVLYALDMRRKTMVGNTRERILETALEKKEG